MIVWLYEASQKFDFFDKGFSMNLDKGLQADGPTDS